MSFLRGSVAEPTRPQATSETSPTVFLQSAPAASEAVRPPAAWRPWQSWTLSERKALLVVGDLTIVVGGLLVTWFADQRVVAGPDRVTVWVALLVAVWVTVAQACDCYDLVVAAHLGSALRSLVTAAVVTVALYWLIPYWSPPLPSSRSVLALSVLLVCGPLVLWRTAYALLATRRAFRIRTLLLGVDSSATLVAKVLSTAGQSDYELVGSVDYAGQSPGELSIADHVLHLVQAHDVRELIVSGSLDQAPVLHATLGELAERGITITAANELYESLTGRALLPAAGGASFLWLPPTSAFYGVARRIFDVSVAALVLLVAAPLLLIVLAAIVVDSPGSPLYAQERVGRYGQRFRMLKLRTMVQHAEGDGQARWARRGDPRITRVGALLRRSRVDEIPQLWNVLRGEMGVIGPRPERPEFVDVLSREVPIYRARHVARPGITGWAQVKYCYGSSVHDTLTKLEYDLYYIRHRSLLLDAAILLKTAAVMVQLKGL